MNEINESLEIAKNLKEWFTEIAVKKMKRNFKKNLLHIKENGKVIGFLNYKKNKKSIVILWMGCKRDCQRKGIGSKLIQELERFANSKSIKTIKVETLTDEDSYEPYKLTRNFYYKNGFKKKFIKKAKKKGYDDLLVMEKKL